MELVSRWSNDDIPWGAFDPATLDADTLMVVKAAALTERNAEHYTAYLRNVFAGDPAFQALAEQWAREEVQHGEALGRYAEMADPDFDFPAVFARFRREYVIPTEVTVSRRGSRTGELLSRCVVEVGTSSFYTALADGVDEPVLKALCRKIAADEFRHYKLFLDYMKGYKSEGVGLLARVWVAYGRVREADDDELAFAYHCANEPGQTFDLARCNQAYARRAYRFYRWSHAQRAVAMIFKAVGLEPHGLVGRMVTRAAWRGMRRRAA